MKPPVRSVLLAISVALLHTASAALFDKTATFTPSFGLTENYGESIATTTVNVAGAAQEGYGQEGYQQEGYSYNTYTLQKGYAGGFTAVVSLAGFDASTINASTSLEVQIGQRTVTLPFSTASTLTSSYALFTSPANSTNPVTATVSWSGLYQYLYISYSEKRLDLTPSVPDTFNGNTPTHYPPFDDNIADGVFKGFLLGGLAGPGAINFTDSVRIKFGQVGSGFTEAHRLLEAGIQRTALPGNAGTHAPTQEGYAPTYDVSTTLDLIGVSAKVNYVPPTLALVSPTSSVVYLPTVDLAVNSNGSTVTAKVGTNAAVAMTASATVPGQFVLPGVSLVEGPNTVLFTATDHSGNVNTLTRSLYLSTVQGSYTGLLPNHQGVVQLIVNTDNTFSGYVLLQNGARVPFNGKLNGRTQSISIPILGQILKIDLDLGGTQPGVFNVALTYGGTTTVATLGRHVFSGGGSQPAFVGYATAELHPATAVAKIAGFGAASLTVSSNGNFSLAGAMPDGSYFSYSGAVDQNNQATFFAQLPFGYLDGAWTLTPGAAGTAPLRLAGHWGRLPMSTITTPATFYNGTVDVDLVGNGTPYRPGSLTYTTPYPTIPLGESGRTAIGELRTGTVTNAANLLLAPIKLTLAADGFTTLNLTSSLILPNPPYYVNEGILPLNSPASSYLYVYYLNSPSGQFFASFYDVPSRTLRYLRGLAVSPAPGFAGGIYGFFLTSTASGSLLVTETP